MCANGLLRFRDGFYQTYPRNFGTYFFQLNDPCLAPYWSLVDLNSYSSGYSEMFVYTVDNERLDWYNLFQQASEYGQRLLQKNEYDTLWVALFTWKNLRPLSPGSFCGVSFIFSISCLQNIMATKYSLLL